VLSHKVREKFNEGANPNLGIRRDRLILNIVRRVLTSPGFAAIFGHAPAKQAAPAPVRLPGPAYTPIVLSEPQVLQILGEFAHTRIFANQLVRGYPHFSATVLPTADHVRIWANAIDSTLQPYATPADVQQNVSQGFWALMRALRPGQQLDMKLVQQVGNLYSRTFEELEQAANPAGQERAHAARQAVGLVVAAIVHSPANPQNAPQAAQSWGQ
jgi:hypothetical protein